MKKFSILLLVWALFLWNCSSSQDKECECPQVQQSQDDKSKEPASSTGTRSGEADQDKSGEAVATKEEAKPAPQDTKPTGAGKSGEADSQTTSAKPVESGKSGEATEPSKTADSTQPTSFPDPKTPIGQKPLNTASSILGGSGEKDVATGSRQGTGTQVQSSSSTGQQSGTKDQIRKIDRESDYVIPPQVVPIKGGQSSNQPAPQKGAGSLGFQCEDYNEDTKSVVCKGNASTFKGESLLEFDARKFKKLFFGFDLTLRSGELEVQIPGQQPTKVTPSKPFVYLGEVQSTNDKVQVKVKANPNEAQGIDYIVRLLYHGKG
ncbi:MAG: hypothetical protein N3A69_10085 [Leptospiraceae bacterium]|nr:hypothetical protein [Leptospiraceae bacterium]